MKTINGVSVPQTLEDLAHAERTALVVHDSAGFRAALDANV